MKILIYILIGIGIWIITLLFIFINAVIINKFVDIIYGSDSK